MDTEVEIAKKKQKNFKTKETPLHSKKTIKESIRFKKT